VNQTVILYNLEEAHEELGLIIRDLKRDADGYSEERLRRAMEHVMHHVNIAWNARDAADGALHDATEDELSAWSAYPADLVPLSAK